MSKFLSKDEIEKKILKSISEDESLREKLVEQPHAAVEEIIRESLSPEVNVVVHEEDDNTVHIVLPPRGFIDNSGDQQLWGPRGRHRSRDVSIVDRRHNGS